MQTNEMAETSLKGFHAEEEYKKNPELRKDDIEALMKWSLTKGFPNISEEMMILFHHSCFFDMKATKNCIETYYDLRKSTPEFFKNRDVNRSELQQALKVLYYSSFPVKDPNGYQIIYHGLQEYDAWKYVFNDGVKLLVMAVDGTLHDNGTAPGYIFLFNMKGVRVFHLMRLGVSSLKKFFTYIQEGMPVRLKAIHVVNTMPIVDKIMFMIKPFIKKELLSLIHFHSSDYKEVQKYLPKHCLPSDFGGELSSIHEMHEEYCNWISRLKPYFTEDERFLEATK